jgi:response regulator RpfG family c-di-GMP phosphodiesterase
VIHTELRDRFGDCIGVVDKFINLIMIGGSQGMILHSMNTNTPIVVLSEDGKRSPEILQKEIEISRMDIRTFHDGSGTVEFLQKKTTSILIADFNLPDIDGLDVIQQLQNSHIEFR